MSSNASPPYFSLCQFQIIFLFFTFVPFLAAHLCSRFSQFYLRGIAPGSRVSFLSKMPKGGLDILNYPKGGMCVWWGWCTEMDIPSWKGCSAKFPSTHGFWYFIVSLLASLKLAYFGHKVYSLLASDKKQQPEFRNSQTLTCKVTFKTLKNLNDSETLKERRQCQRTEMCCIRSLLD